MPGMIPDPMPQDSGAGKATLSDPEQYRIGAKKPRAAVVDRKLAFQHYESVKGRLKRLAKQLLGRNP